MNCSVLHASRLALYARRLARSDFALMVRGDSPSSRRLYDALAFGAVPVIISDRLWHVALPFPGKARPAGPAALPGPARQPACAPSRRERLALVTSAARDASASRRRKCWH